MRDANTLSWHKVGFGVGREDEYYECYESSSKGLFFLFHLLKNDNSGGKIRIFTIDTHDSLVTLISGSIGLLDYTPHNTNAAPFFWYIDWHDGAQPPQKRHYYTLELIQKNILWKVNSNNQISASSR